MARSVCLLAVCAAAAVAPTAARGRRRPPASASNSFVRRSDNATEEAISPHDQVCREYLHGFLAGTTDAR